MKKLPSESSAGGSQRSVRPSWATWPLKFFGVAGGVLSRWNVRGADQAETLPAASCARACHQYMPSPSRSGRAHAAVAPLISVGEVPLEAVARQAPSEQTRNSIVPVPANAGLLNVACREAARGHGPSTGSSSAGTVGAELSIWKLRVALQPDWLPVRSCARTCQWYVPSGSGAGVSVAVPPLASEPEVAEATKGAHAVPAGADVEQIRRSIVPLSPGVASENTALSCGIALVSRASAGDDCAGVAGATVSTCQE